MTLYQQIHFALLPEPVEEYRFEPSRRWRFDYAYPEIKVAIEIEGAVYAQGRHTRGRGFENDCRKYNHAALLGWRILRFSTGMVDSGEALDAVEKLFTKPGNAAP